GGDGEVLRRVSLVVVVVVAFPGAVQRVVGGEFVEHLDLASNPRKTLQPPPRRDLKATRNRSTGPAGPAGPCGGRSGRGSRVRGGIRWSGSLRGAGRGRSGR